MKLDFRIISTAIANDIVAQGEWPSLPMEKITDCILSTFFSDQIGLGENAKGTLSILIKFFGELQDFLGGDVNIARQNSQDDRALVFNVLSDEVVHHLHVIFSCAVASNAENSRN